MNFSAPLVPALNERLVQAGRGVQLDSKGNVLSLIQEKGQVLEEEYTAEGTRVVALLDAPLYQRVLGMLGGR